ncbi:DUF1036 domain-containing protein [Alkalicaulis satelles]|uniref:DUF1036 domain-containing protein n=1 Tax=Alkalicaulis satelles TaxID=2609175 RepID=A0A5M6ZMW7_9PROT|nr:DUF1036 domain-containing protein [Alkalicaulis satelles]KAA5804934.1 DUF1036 domain-containing protein [Alkalicaulis satelles]
MRRALAVLALAGALAAPAAAGEVCNETSFMVDVAKAWRTGAGLSVEGWTRIAPGACASIGPGAESDQFLYARSTPAYPGGVREWRGGLDVCVDETDFAFEGVADCAALGLQSRQFRRLNEAERSRAVLVELDDFGERAEEAGLQRLLQANGYDIRLIDGFAGRRTRRQISAFEADAGQTFGDDKPALIEALHALALERNNRTGLRVCNDESAPMAAAFARRQDGAVQVRGWWRIEPGACARLISERLDADGTYIHVRLLDPRSERLLSGVSQQFCIAPGRFSNDNPERCDRLGFQLAGFRPVPAPDPETGGVTVRLSGPDFEEADA